MNKYFIEQINVSDQEYKIIEIRTENKKIEVGELIFSYESSKATFDVISESAGFLYLNPNIILNSQYRVGTLIAVTCTNSLSEVELNDLFKLDVVTETKISPNQQSIITRKAKALIEKFQIDISNFENIPVVTEEIIQSIISKRKFENDFQDISFYYKKESLTFFKQRPKKLAIIGAGKAALQLLDAVISSNSHTPVLIYDENKLLYKHELLGIKIKNTIDVEVISKDFQEKLFDEIIISFSGDIVNREKIFNELLINNIPIANVIHPTAIIGNFTSIGIGNLIFANSRIGPFAMVGNNNVISSFCSIEHHNSIGSHNTFGPTVVFSGSCTVGNQNRFGTGIFIEPNVKIGSNNIIASGITLLTNIPDKKLVRNLAKSEIKNIS